MSLFKKIALIIITITTIVFVAAIIAFTISIGLKITDIPEWLSTFVIIGFTGGGVGIVIGIILLVVATIIDKK